MLGRNGVGKSTLLKYMIGSCRAAAAVSLHKGGEVTRLPADHRARAGIGYVPQGRVIFPN